ncbi:MAG TPA: hypothetical protein VGB83_02420 [Actinomycetota bacterium]
MSEYLLALIERDLSMPTPEEFARRLAKASAVDLGRLAARDIEELRSERDAVVDPGARRRGRATG